MSTIGANPSLPGEGMLKWVKKQVDARQRIYGKKENRTPEEINFLNNTKPWIKLASSVRIKDSSKLAKAGLSQYGQGRNLAKNFVLFNGVSINAGDGLGEGFRSGIGLGNDVAYGIGGKDFGYKPMPGIESVSVSTKGNYGGLKEATIKIFAYNKQQFDIIELLYLRLGYSVLLEFGHSQYVDNNNQVRQMGPTMTDTTWFDNAFFEIPAETISSINGTQRLAGRYQTTSDTLNDLPFDFGQGDKLGAKAQDLRNLASKRANAAVQKNIMEAQKLLLDIKKRYVGNYEGMIGKISNFSWDLNSNGVYQITLKVITYGDLVDGFFVNTKKVFPKDGEIGKGLVANIVGGIVNFFSGLFGGDDEPDPPEIPDIDRKFLRNAKDVTDINGILYMFYDGLYNSLRSTPYANRKNIGGGNPWKFYTENINEDNTAAFKGSSPADIFDIKTVGSADDEKGEGYTDDKYISLGYYLDILNKFTMGFIEEGTEDITGFEPNADSENGPIQFDNSQDTFFCNTSFYQISGDPTICLIKNTGAPASIITDDHYRDFKKRKNGILVGDIMNIYLQMNYLAELCYNAAKNKDSKITVKDHIETILNAVSESLGGLNRLKVKCDENTGKLYIFDENPIPGRTLITEYNNPGANNQKPVEFLVYGFEGDKGSFVRDFGIKSRIDNSLSTMITIGKNKTGITPGYDATPFANWNEGLEDIVMPSLIVASQNSNDLASYKEEYKEKLESLANLANKLYKNDEKVKLKYTSQTKNVLREVVMAEQAVHAAENKEDGGSSPLAGFLPISLELTIDGLSGMKVFQTYTVPNSFLPAAYPKAFDFILKKYSHEVNKDAWTTKFESFSIPSAQKKPLDQPWYQLSAGVLASIIAEAEQEKNDAEFAAQTDLFNSRSSVRGAAALGGVAGAGALGLGAGVGQEINADNLTLAKTASPGSIQRVKNLVAKFESRGNYGIFNYGKSGGNGASTDGLKAYSAGGVSDITTQTFEWINTRFQRQTGRGQAFATGKYQIIPNTLQSFLSRNPDFKSKLFNVENQEALGDYLFTKKRTSAGNYLLGKNAGTQKDLSDAVQDIGYEFASMPVIKLSNGTIVGDVVSGTGKGAYYGGQGPNPSTSKVSVATMVIALIGSRIDYTGQQPQFIPSYYT